MSSVIQTENLVKKFRRVEALKGLNLQVPQGAIYALVGPNGAGKTTAIKVLMNILEPTSGRAQILGADSTQLEGKAFAAIGYVSENQELPLWMRVDSFLAYLRPFYPTWDRELENELVKKLELPLDRKLRHLSRGMKMKAALASVLAYHPKLIVLDEPFSGLDPLVRDELIESMLERAEEATVLVSSHDLGEIESFASHVGYLEEGTLLFSDEMAALADRFREVELTLDATATVPPNLPESWMQASAAASVVQFIDSSFNEERTTAEIGRVFGEHRNLTFTPMSLRSIFLATAKTRRGAKEAHEPDRKHF
ncbi:MAG TPA: ABC transporter ATP-binding protein [Candidatus Angelobacter sp.]